MKKQYTTPQIEVVMLDPHDLIATSGDDTLDFGTGGGSGLVGAALRDDWSIEDW